MSPATIKDPLIYQLAHGLTSPLEAKPDAAIRRIRNKLRKYSATSIIELVLRILSSNYPTQADELKSMPWLTLLLAKWAAQDSLVHLNVGPVIPGSVFDQLRQELWDIQGAASKCGPLINIFTILRSRVHVQVQFQKKESWAFIRWPALIARLESNHLTRQQFRQVMLMEPETFIDLCWAAYAAVNDGKSLIALSFFEPLRPHYGQSIDQFLSLFVRDISTLRNELQSLDLTRFHGQFELLH